jgi:uncharacterized protein (TIGR00251 family)
MTRPWLRVVDGTVRLAVRAKPRSRKEGVEDGDTELVVRVRAPPVDGAANERVIEVLATALAIPQRDVVLVRGDSARHKELEVRGLSLDEVVVRLTSCR